MTPANFFSARNPNSGSGSATVAPSDSANLVNPATNQAELALALYVEVAGAVAFVGADGQTDTWNVPNNFYINVPVKKVKATGTTATGIHAIW